MQTPEAIAIRRNKRHAEGLSCRVFSGGCVTTAQVVDLSAGGVGLLCASPHPPDTALGLELAGRNGCPAARREGTVAWCREEGGAYRMGCAFLRPLAPAELALLLS